MRIGYFLIIPQLQNLLPPIELQDERFAFFLFGVEAKFLLLS